MVTPMALEAEKGAATAFSNVVLGRLMKVLENKYQLWSGIQTEISSLHEDLKLLAAAVDDHQVSAAASSTAVARVYGEQIRELTHDIEDCVERFLHRITCKPGASRARRTAHAFRTLRRRLLFADKIKKFRRRVADARKRAFNADATAAAAAAISPYSGGAQPSNNQGYVQDCRPVGIAKAIMELRALLGIEPNQGRAAVQAQLRVVAVVGFGGSGKTTLGRAVYSIVQRALPCAWVDGHLLDRTDSNGIVKHIQENLRSEEGRSATSLHQDQDSRYLIVIDGIKRKHQMHWDTLRNAFRNNGRIILTTNNWSVANRCCNHPREEDKYTFGRVYNMRSLGEEDSRKLALLGRVTPELLMGSKELLEKCGGLPLALYSVACQLSSEMETTGELCRILCSDLGTYLEREDDEPNFARLRGVLRENYTSLSDYIVRTCLLYLGIFPIDRPLKKNVIIRRWLAEGYARHYEGRHQSVADKNFKTFTHQSIILPAVPISNFIEKACKIHGIMHTFILHKSISKKFIMPFGTQHNKVRHLFIHNSRYGNYEISPDMDLSRARSLTVVGKAGGAISKFNKYKLARVLDLEGCIDVEDFHVKEICKLWNLRYLSLGPDITEIPKEIAQLKLLETLDVSKTRVNVLPVEAIGLPCLIHLIGKFKLQDPVKTERLPQKCMLETLAGIVADKGRGFSQLMDHTKKLKKVKVWCECEETEQGQIDMNNQLAEAIQKYIETPMDEDNVENYRSLSLYFQRLPQGSMTALEQLCQRHSSRKGYLFYLSSLKLHGNSNPTTLPKFVAMFHDLAKLSISTTMSVTQHLLSVLGEMHLMKYLKLAANSIDDDDGFVIQKGKFGSLKRLCLVLKVVGPSVLTIKDRGAQAISSLQLICKDLVGLSGVEISYLPNLKEIVLHPDVGEETRQAWKAEARNHRNMPHVLSIPGDHVREETAAVEEEPALEDPMEVEPESNFPNSIGLHVNEAQQGCDKEALVLAPVQPRKANKRKRAQVLKSANTHEEDIADINMEDAGDNLAASINDFAIDDEGHKCLLYRAVMTVPGFPEEALSVAVSHLIDNKAQGSAYMGMHEEHRVLWLRNFLGKLHTI
ncbi:disease resistance protein RGA4 isoform X1 [Triticum aestivum]|uniref:disease resistance protein RGA4 isoform X1 n=1 Tax=Triticum aestivum TaxID=4565 RepID=UPI000845866A|nr:disease resistance protein RGA4-like isoform X1 [Triticum aestivum]